MSKDEESDRNSSGKVKVEQDTRKALDLSDSGLYYKVTVSSRKRCDTGSL